MVTSKCHIPSWRVPVTGTVAGSVAQNGSPPLAVALEMKTRTLSTPSASVSVACTSMPTVWSLGSVSIWSGDTTTLANEGGVGSSVPVAWIAPAPSGSGNVWSVLHPPWQVQNAYSSGPIHVP